MTRIVRMSRISELGGFGSTDIEETSIKVQGKKYWIRAFTTPAETFVVIRNSRGTKVLMGVLAEVIQGNNRV